MDLVKLKEGEMKLPWAGSEALMENGAGVQSPHVAFGRNGGDWGMREGRGDTEGDGDGVKDGSRRVSGDMQVLLNL